MEKSPASLFIQNSFSQILHPFIHWIARWTTWWHGLSFFKKVFPLFAVGFYWSLLQLAGGLREDHLLVGLVLLFFSYTGSIGRHFLRFGLPFFLTAIVYDSQRFYSDWIRGPVHVREPYLFDKAYFGISTPQGILTPNEWLQLHTTPLLDLVAGFAYLVFFAAFILICAYFIYILRTRSQSPEEKQSSTRLGLQVPWAFFWLNVLGYSTYYWYAAAPPWYVALYGLGPVQMDVPANAAGCSRFDEILGTHFFSEMYGRAADVFGTVPSLHVAYPMLALYFAFRFKTARAFCTFFYLLMCFAAVYLNHHYILDILWGSSYALLVGWLTDKLFTLRAVQVT